MHQFDEHHPEFAGFSDAFARTVQPVLAERDGLRRAAVKRGLLAVVVCTVLGTVASLLLWRATDADDTVLLAMPTLFGPVVGFILFGVLTQKVRSDTKSRIVTAVTDHIGWQFDSHVSSFNLAPFESHYLLTKAHDRRSFEDRLSGSAHGAAFESVEAHLEKRRRDSKGRETWSTVFRGQLMRIDFPTRTFGRTVVLRDRKMFNRKKKGDMKRVGLADPVFERAFEAYGTDQVEARVILDPAFMQRMVDLEASVDGKRIRFAFADNDLFIAVETSNRYEAGSMFKPLDAPERTQRILDEIGAIYDIVDGVLAKMGR
ncbi:MAG: DUF3137 domain-containing protein [Litorimonas sp.]